MTYTDILYDVENMVATITLNRPSRMNALTFNTYKEIEHAIKTADRNNDVRAVIITGAGRGFCSGDDVKDIKKPTPPATIDWSSDNLEPNPEMPVASKGKPLPLAQTLFDFDKPLIAAINGACIGWGMEIALMCDIRFAATEAKFCEAFILRGMIADVPGTMLLPRIVGLSKAYEILLTGAMIDGAEAERIGLVSKTVQQEELMPTARAVAEHIASLPPIAVRMTKEAVRKGQDYDFPAASEYFNYAMTILFETEDFAEGNTAVLEKRNPTFKGR